MKICAQAEHEKKSQLESIVLNGAYYVNPVVGIASSTALTLFSPHKVRHEWIIITTSSGSIFCIEFARSEQSRPEIVISHHQSEKSANDAGASGIGNGSYHTVREKRQTKDRTLEDVINHLHGLDQDYNVVFNNCQYLASELYSEFADIKIRDLMLDQQKRYNTPGFSRGIDNSVSVTCTLS
ncbi:hypothetical protein [Legionella drancourtii]|uniref:Uncharacterized protein n=1 Tax=Legionella drancourtii LLAP12 TaxID=658187 RepID=G9EKJ3_9GAMM|nr:hypothetical protein [Legionella drancourtii]EHL32344.1 hypothetical protein LDG_5728 [Legionella drancourtii LLAP12]